MVQQAQQLAGGLSQKFHMEAGGNFRQGLVVDQLGDLRIAKQPQYAM